MQTKTTQIDVLTDQVKRPPEERQQAIVDALREMLDEPYILSDDDLAILRPARADAQTDVNVAGAATDDILNTPWTSGSTSRACPV